MSRRILIVDDDNTILMVFKALLEDSQLVVDTADSVEKAQELVQKQNYQAVITDLRLTGIEGREGLEVIAAFKKHSPDTRVILLTAYGTPDLLNEALGLGIDLYLEKPVSSADLRQALNGLGIM